MPLREMIIRVFRLMFDLARCAFHVRPVVSVVLIVCLLYPLQAENSRRRTFLEHIRMLETYVDTAGAIRSDSVYGQESLMSDSILFRRADKIGKDALRKGRHVSAIAMFEDALAYFGDTPGMEGRGFRISIRVVLGAAYADMGLWAKAMELYMAALDECGTEFDNRKAAACNNMGNIYFKQGYYEKAKYWYDSAITVNMRLENKQELVNNYNNLSGLYYMQSDYFRTLTALSQALGYVNYEKDPDLYYLIWTNMATVYNRQGRKAVAEEMARSVIDFWERNDRRFDLISVYLLMADIKRTTSPDTSYRYLMRALDISRSLSNKEAEIRVLKNLYEWYHDKALYKEACQVLERTELLQDSLVAADNRLRMENLEAAYEAERQRQVKDIQQKEREIEYLQMRHRQMYLIMAIGGMVVVLIVVVLLYVYQRRLRKRDSLLSKQQAELHDKENEINNRRKQELQESLELRNRELTSKVLHIVKNNEYILDINRELQQLLLEINPKDKAKKEHIQRMLLKLRNQGNEGTYAEFRYYFEQVYQSFYEGLQKSYPELTYRDLRLCSFLRLGLSSKEIAAITFKEVRSVESARNRLRKKMGLGPEVNLIEFFSRF